jgi:hypothetical protein
MSPGKESGRETNARFGILGTGVVGKTIASRLDDMEHEVTVGTRDPEEPASRAEPGAYGNPHSASGKRNTPGSSSPRSAKRPPTMRWSSTQLPVSSLWRH